MRIELPCEIIKDLLPNYIDGLESDVTKTAVEEHLSSCESCSEICDAMKKGYDQKADAEPEQAVKEEKVLFRKINRKLNRKVKIVIAVGVAVLLIAVGAFELLFNAVIREVPRQEVEVTAEVYPMAEIAASDQTMDGVGYGINSGGDEVCVVRTGDEAPGEDEPSFTISIPDFPESHIAVTPALMEEYDTLTMIKWKSPYFLRAILWDIRETDGQRIMYIEHYKTTILNSKEANSGSYTTSIDFGTLDKIVYLEKDGSETVLWENKD